jgi:hypothetical protein
MRNPQGYATIIHPAGPLEEHDTVTCIHCGQIGMTRSSFSGIPEVLVYRADGTHYMREGGFCRNCMAHTCGRGCCVECNNRFRRMDNQETAARKRLLCS